MCVLTAKPVSNQKQQNGQRRSRWCRLDCEGSIILGSHDDEGSVGVASFRWERLVAGDVGEEGVGAIVNGAGVFNANEPSAGDDGVDETGLDGDADAGLDSADDAGLDGAADAGLFYCVAS